jgi:hypothetical protein
VSGEGIKALIYADISLNIYLPSSEHIPHNSLHGFKPRYAYAVLATSSLVFSLVPYVDYILMLNNYLQNTGEAHLLSWEFSQSGPEHQATHTAVAKRAFRWLSLR